MIEEIMAENEVDAWEPPVMETDCELVLNLSNVSDAVTNLQIEDDQHEPAVVENAGFTDAELLDY